MTQSIRNLRLIAFTLVLESWRRKEIYLIVLVTTLLIVGLRFVHFFDVQEVGKFYREICLKTMNVTTALTVILLSARQLPREFSNRTIYPLLAKPISRWEFLIGKFIGVMGASLFCYALFMVLFVVGSLTLHTRIHAGLFAQSIYLQVLSLMVLSSLVFLLSMLLNGDAAITISAILYFASQVMMNLMSFLYDFVGGVSRFFLLCLHFILPQLTLFDASGRVVHSYRVNAEGEMILVWGNLSAVVMFQLTAYALVYVFVFLTLAQFCFKKRAL